jgi:hypothetical protein
MGGVGAWSGGWRGPDVRFSDFGVYDPFPVFLVMSILDPLAQLPILSLISSCIYMLDW